MCVDMSILSIEGRCAADVRRERPVHHYDAIFRRRIPGVGVAIATARCRGAAASQLETDAARRGRDLAAKNAAATLGRIRHDVRDPLAAG